MKAVLLKLSDTQHTQSYYSLKQPSNNQPNSTTINRPTLCSSLTNSPNCGRWKIKRHSSFPNLLNSSKGKGRHKVHSNSAKQLIDTNSDGTFNRVTLANDSCSSCKCDDSYAKTEANHFCQNFSAPVSKIKGIVHDNCRHCSSNRNTTESPDGNQSRTAASSTSPTENNRSNSEEDLIALDSSNVSVSPDENSKASIKLKRTTKGSKSLTFAINKTEILGPNCPIPALKTALFAKQLISAIKYLADVGVSHRDLKP